MGFFSKKPAPPSAPKALTPEEQKREDELARQRLAEATQQIALETTTSRTTKAQNLIQHTAGVGSRKGNVSDAYETFHKKGTDPSTLKEEEQVGNVSSMKKDYAENLQRYAEKGKPETPGTAGSLNKDLKATYEHSPTKEVPALFKAKKLSPSDKPAGVASSASPSYASDFSKVEKQEIKMVGEEKHITTTGLDLEGRRVTKKKIVLPKQQAATVSQNQQKSAASCGTRGPSVPAGWDGKFISLVDLRQQRVQGIDKHNKEQYLSPEEFQKAFKMTKEEFAKLPKWKRDKLKRDLYLF